MTATLEKQANVLLWGTTRAKQAATRSVAAWPNEMVQDVKLDQCMSPHYEPSETDWLMGACDAPPVKGGAGPSLEALTPEEAEVIELTAMRGYSTRDAAEMLGVSKSHVNNLHRRAVRKLRHAAERNQ